MEAIKQTLFTNWHAMRWVRLGFGLFLAVQAIQLFDVFSGVVSAFFLFQAATNTGCCGAAGCATTPTATAKTNSADDIQFEELGEPKK